MFDEWFHRRDFEGCLFNVLLEMGRGIRSGRPRSCTWPTSATSWPPVLAAVAARELGAAAVAVTAVSASLPDAERRAAAVFARTHGIAHVEVCTDRRNGRRTWPTARTAAFTASRR